MADRRLAEAFRPLAEALLPDRVLTQERAVGGALNDDSTVRRESVINAIPWMVRDLFLLDDTEAGGVVRRLAFPQRSRIRHVAITAATPPTGDPFIVRLSAGAYTEAFSLPAGQGAATSGVDLPVDPGTVVEVTTSSAHNAERITISIHYTGGTQT